MCNIVNMLVCNKIPKINLPIIPHTEKPQGRGLEVEDKMDE